MSDDRKRKAGDDSDFQSDRSVKSSRLATTNVFEREYNEQAPPGDVMTFGSDDCFQLGLSDETTTNRPRFVKNLVGSDAVQVACGGLHNVALLQNGTAYTWGCNDDGALAREAKEEDEERIPLPVQGLIPSEYAVVCTDVETEDGSIMEVAAGGNTTLFLTPRGNVYIGGCYKDEDNTSFRVMRPPDDATEDILRNDDETVKRPPFGSHFKPTHIYQMPDEVRHVASGSTFSVAVLKNNTLVTWGIGTHGEMGRIPSVAFKTDDDKGKQYNLKALETEYLTPLPPRWAGPSMTRRVISVSCGDHHMLVVAKEEGSFESLMYGTGNNNYGQLALGDNTPRFELTLSESSRGKNIIEVVCGLSHTLCLDSTHRCLYTCGRGDYGQLGLYDDMTTEGYYIDELTLVTFPDANLEFQCVEAGDNHNLALTTDGDVYTWGYGDLGALGHGRDADETRPCKIENITRRLHENPDDQEGTTGGRVHQVAGGGQHSAIIMTRTTHQTSQEMMANERDKE